MIIIFFDDGRGRQENGPEVRAARILAKNVDRRRNAR